MQKRISRMTKDELIYAVADKAQMTRIAAACAVEATFEVITSTLRDGGAVKITGFGQFRVTKLEERQGRNPQTGAPMKIGASRRPRFSPGKRLRDAVNR
jgi:DNA-binding protein HU-beta